MKNALRKRGESLLNVLIAVFFIILIPIALVTELFRLPGSYIKYRRSAYRKDTGERFSVFADDINIALYNDIRAYGLPIDFCRQKNVKRPGGGFFTYGTTLIITWFDPYYDSERGTFDVEIEHENWVGIDIAAAKEIERCCVAPGCPCCQKAMILISPDVFTDEVMPPYENCDIVIADDTVISALKKYVAENPLANEQTKTNG